MTGWWSQRFAAEGAASADGIAKQLGRPAVDPLTILVREAAQNSWDAREGSHVRFALEIRRLGDSAPAWRDLLLPGPGPEAGLHLAQCLRHDSHVLVVSDRGTRGLGGPLRADQAPREGVIPDFVQFLRNVGEASDHKHGGGTYGFGKGIFYSTSTAGAILVDTRCRHDEGSPRRMMGAALGRSFTTADDVRYTGRHWWGQVRDDIPYPLEDEADQTRTMLGLPPFGDEFGTDIVVLGVALGEVAGGEAIRPRTPMEAGQFLVSSILWNLWPKFGSNRRPREMSFAVSVEGRAIPVPDPVEVPELAPFVLARDLVDEAPTKTYARKTEPRIAGDLGLQLVPAQLRGDQTPQILAAAMPVAPPLRHIARMRIPNLVVDYVEEAPHPDPLLAYAGVFRASPEADRAFARSEPPTHDDWVSAGLAGTDKGVVMNLKRFLKDAVNEQYPRTAGGVSLSAEGLGRLSTLLAALIPGREQEPEQPEAEDDAEFAVPKVRGRRGSGRRRKARLVESGHVTLTPYGPRVEADVEVPGGDVPVALVASAAVVVEGGGTEEEPPVGAPIPKVLGWYDQHGTWEPGDELRIPAGLAQRWTLVVSHVEDVQVRLTVETEVEGA